jgi:transcriptional regulator with XRE-family HTH domain
MLFPIKTDLIKKLKDKNYRHKFFRGRAEDEVASQLQEFRKKRVLTQQALAGRCGMKQSAISRIEQAFSTLWRIAKALDVRVRVIFEDMNNVISEYESRANQAAAVATEASVAPQHYVTFPTVLSLHKVPAPISDDVDELFVENFESASDVEVWSDGLGLPVELLIAGSGQNLSYERTD